MQALPGGDAYDKAMAEQASDFGGDSIRREYYRFNGKSGFYQKSKKKDDPGPALKAFDLVGVVLFALPTQDLWPQVDSKTGRNAFGLPATERRVCVAKNSKTGVAFVNQEELDANFLLAKRLDELGWTGNTSGCAACPLRQKDEQAGTSACKPGYDVVMVLVDERTKQPIDAEGIAVVSCSGPTAYNGVRFGMKKLVGARKASIDSVARLFVEPFGQAQSPAIQPLGLASPDLREHCRAMTALVWEAMSNPRNPFQNRNASGFAPHSGSAGVADDGFVDVDIPF